MPDQNAFYQNEDKHLDDLLESMLSTYSVVEPRPGLETRIVTLMHHAAKKTSRWTLVWMGSAVAVAAILLIIYFSCFPLQIAQPHPQSIEAIKTIPRPKAVKVPSNSASAMNVPVKNKSARSVVSEEISTLADKDRPSVFPTPVALSDQEKLLFRYLATTPREEVIAQSHSDEAAEELPQDQSVLPATTRQTVAGGTQ